MVRVPTFRRAAKCCRTSGDDGVLGNDKGLQGDLDELVRWNGAEWGTRPLDAARTA